MPDSATPAAPYLFLSYSSADRDRALALADLLEVAGIPVWLDRRSLVGGSSWDAAIVRAITGCTALAVLCSPTAVASPNVTQEVRLAWEERRPLLPLLLAPVPFPDELRYMLTGRQWVELLDRPQEDWLADLLQAVTSLGFPLRRLSAGTAAPPTEEASGGGPPPLVHLPAALTRLIGREDDVAAASALLATARLLTLTGPGGIGKTRLGLAIAAAVPDRFPDGVWFVDLTTVQDAANVPLAIAQVLGIREAEGQAPAVALLAALRARHLLLVLDNLEHLLAAGAFLRELLATAPGLTLLVTSRSVLHLPGEQQVDVQPLALPEAGAPVAAVAETPAVALFVERAREVRPAFALTAENAAAVAEICRRLEGLPLALELAAARVKLLPPPQLLSRLDQRLAVLTGGGEAVPVRQRTLREAIRWSYELLSAEEQRLFRALAVFDGGCTLEAAEAVGGQADGLEVFEGLASLVDKSLLRQREGADGAARFSMLVTLREFGLEQATACGELAGLEERHAAWVVELAEAAQPLLETAGRAPWLDGLSREQDNVRAALGWALREGRCETGLRIVGALAIFYWLRSAAEGRRWVEQFLACTVAPVSPAVRARALFAAGYMYFAGGNLSAAATHFTESAVLWRQEEDHRELGTTLVFAGVFRMILLGDTGPLADAEEGIALLRQSGDAWRLGWGLSLLSVGHALSGSPAPARLDAEEGMAILLTRLEDRWLGSAALGATGVVAVYRGDLAAAQEALVAALPALKAQGPMYDTTFVLQYLCVTLNLRGAHAAALAYVREALDIVVTSGQEHWIPTFIDQGALALANLGQPRCALQLMAGLQLAGGANELPTAQKVKSALEAIRTQLGDEAFAAAWTEGQRLSLQELVALAQEPVEQQG